MPMKETLLGYLRSNPNSGFIPPSNANGGVGQFVYNLNKWIGGVVRPRRCNSTVPSTFRREYRGT